VISWPKHFPAGREIQDFVNIKDFAPTLLELAGIELPTQMTAKSFVDLLTTEKTGKIDPERDHVVMARERHAFVRKGGIGYPGRAIRTDQFLYIKNYQPERWPAGDPPLYGDVDAHMLHYEAPTKIFMLKNKNSKPTKKLFDLAFSKRPQHELYKLCEDPFQMNNLAYDKEYASVRNEISNQLISYLKETGDPRETGAAFDWDNAHYYKDRDKKPNPSEKAIEVLGLETEYNYLE
jgi:arylsulfatase A-like enzyme